MFSIGATSPIFAIKPASPVEENLLAPRSAEDPRGQPGRGRSSNERKANGTEKADGVRGGAKAGPSQLEPAEVQEVQELAERDRQVRAHEAAHQAAAGSLGGAASFAYKTGPDGKSYAVGGEVSVDMSAGRTPEETITRAAQIRAAALAPADPSPQDLAVAAQATAMEAAARQEMARQQLAALKAAAANARAHTPAQTTRHDVEIALVGSQAKGTAVAGQMGLATGEAARPSPVSEVSAQSVATTMALEISRVNAGPSLAQLQQTARLASVAYRAGMAHGQGG